jgi:LysM repeat protein
MKWFWLIGFLGFVQVMSAQTAKCPIQPSKNRIEYAENLKEVHAKLFRIQNHLDSTFVVVHIGDSHIQLDHFSGAIRSHLQQAYGDCGEGVLFPYSACKSFGPRHLESKMVGNWVCNTILNNKAPDGLGVTGYVMRTQDAEAQMSFKYLLDSAVAAALPAGAVSRKTVTIWHGKNDYPLALDCGECGTEIHRENSSNTRNICCTKIYNYPAQTELKLRFNATAPGGQFEFHGISFDTPKPAGIQYHHCGVVGAQFVHFIRNAPLAISQLAELKPDLIMFSFGSNDGYMGFNASQFDIGIQNLLQAIRTELPKVNFLFMTPPDTRAGGKTPPSTQLINAHLRKLSAENRAAFWDLFTIMGGDNSVLYWLQHKLARTDKLHFTRAGYVLMGDLFALAFMDSYNHNYDHGPSTESLVQQIASEAAAYGIRPPFAGDAEVYMTPEARAYATHSSTPKKPVEPFKSRSIFHVVERGETFFSIAKKYEETIDQIKAYNKMGEDAVLKYGQRIVVKRVE